MKPLATRNILRTLLLLGLTSCTPTGSLSNTSVPEGEKRFLSEEGKISEFDDGLPQGFGLADGYTNGGAFSCYFSKEAAVVQEGKLKMSVYKKDDTLYGAEFRSWQKKFHYGYYAVKMKSAPCSGIVSSFFTFTYSGGWDEIDIEFLGKNMKQVQFNYYTKGVGGHEFLLNLPFDSSEDFHEYGFDWKEDSITWYVDGVPCHKATENIPNLPQQIMMNVWSCQGHDTWSGKLDESHLPATAEYEYFGYIAA